jgi:hypothetical protein
LKVGHKALAIDKLMHLEDNPAVRVEQELMLLGTFLLPMSGIAQLKSRSGGDKNMLGAMVQGQLWGQQNVFSLLK